MGNMELLCKQCRRIGPHLAVRGKSQSFSQVAAGTWGILSGYCVIILQSSCLFTTSRLLSSYEGHLRNLFKAWQDNTDASRGEAGDPGSLSSCHSDIVITIIFKKSLTSSPLEALYSRCLLRCQRDVRPPVQIWRV